MKTTVYFSALLSVMVMWALTSGCTGGSGAYEPVHRECNSVYYWKTVFAADSAERAFMEEHGIGRVYMRFFDVYVEDDLKTGTTAVVPNATLQFRDTLPPGVEPVPTVFITLDALKNMKDEESRYAAAIVKRVSAMCSYHRLGLPAGLQLDCDWTATTDSLFFTLCAEVKKELVKVNPSALLSSTIRLHQLRQKAPPVDYGVLMVYNTGSFLHQGGENSILSVADVKPYLKFLPDYPLHLDVAYPAYSWNLIYNNGRFKALLRDEDGFEPAPGDSVVCESSDFAVVSEVKRLVEERLGDKPHSTVIYHLDSKNLSQYSYDEIQTLYQ